ncbi:hypothetical protein OSG_eHP4_00040 [environmental Halophage eHP-4]|nr:hypothetical protein OSG_eHP4_00040 [environmental Halophage eHP-4]
MAVTVSDVEALESKGWQSLDSTTKQDLLDDAKAERDTLYSGRVARTPILDGDEEVFIKNLTAHKWELAEGGEAQSESQTGGNTSYNLANAEPREYLTETRFGRTCLEHLDQRQGIGIVRSY